MPRLLGLLLEGLLGVLLLDSQLRVRRRLLFALGLLDGLLAPSLEFL